jgi:Flp pilus assembly protein TadG
MRRRWRCARSHHPRADQRGSASVELAVLALPCVMLLALMASGFRIADAQHRISGVASAAAREASLGRDASSAEALAQAKATQELNAKTLTCAPPTAGSGAVSRRVGRQWNPRPGHRAGELFGAFCRPGYSTVAGLAHLD